MEAKEARKSKRSKKILFLLLFLASFASSIFFKVSVESLVILFIVIQHHRINHWNELIVDCAPQITRQYLAIVGSNGIVAKSNGSVESPHFQQFDQMRQKSHTAPPTDGFISGPFRRRRAIIDRCIRDRVTRPCRRLQ